MNITDLHKQEGTIQNQMQPARFHWQKNVMDKSALCWCAEFKLIVFSDDVFRGVGGFIYSGFWLSREKVKFVSYWSLVL